MSRLLAIETSSELCSIALSVDGEVWEKNVHEPRKHAELLLPGVAHLLEQANVKLQALDAIAFGRGPGSFTSLRIGIGVVQGLAWGAQIGVVPVSSLAALAQAGAEKTKVREGAEIMVAMDARMGEVFFGRYLMSAAGIVTADGSEQVVPPENLDLLKNGEPLAVGNGFDRYPVLHEKLAENTIIIPDVFPTAKMVLKLADHWLSDHAALPAHQAQPLYVRDDVAKKPGQV